MGSNGQEGGVGIWTINADNTTQKRKRASGIDSESLVDSVTYSVRSHFTDSHSQSQQRRAVLVLYCLLLWGHFLSALFFYLLGVLVP